MRTVYTQEDASELKRLGSAMRPRELVYVTPISNGTQVEVEGATATGDVVAVASNGKTVWPLTQNELNSLQKAKRPPAPSAGATTAGTAKAKEATAKA